MDSLEILQEEVTNNIRPHVHEIANKVQILEMQVKEIEKREIEAMPVCCDRHAEIKTHIDNSKFTKGIIASLVLLALVQICGFIYFYGRLTQLVEINTARISSLEIMFPRSVGPQGIQGIQGIPGRNKE